MMIGSLQGSITPLFKQGEGSYIDNRAPISIVSIIELLTGLLTAMFLRHLVILLTNFTLSLSLLHASIKSLT